MFDLLSIKRLVVKKILVIFPFIKLILPKNKYQLQTDILSVETLHLIDKLCKIYITNRNKDSSSARNVDFRATFTRIKLNKPNSLRNINSNLIYPNAWNLSMFNQTLYHSYLFRNRSCL